MLPCMYIRIFTALDLRREALSFYECVIYKIHDRGCVDHPFATPCPQPQLVSCIQKVTPSRLKIQSSRPKSFADLGVSDHSEAQSWMAFY